VRQVKKIADLETDRDLASTKPSASKAKRTFGKTEFRDHETKSEIRLAQASIFDLGHEQAPNSNSVAVGKSSAGPERRWKDCLIKEIPRVSLKRPEERARTLLSFL
jgi:hypothetical protein